MLKRPRNPSTKLRDLPDCYKIKLRTLGYRLVYQVNDKELLVLVIAIGKREYSAVYEDATKRLDEWLTQMMHHLVAATAPDQGRIF